MENTDLIKKIEELRNGETFLIDNKSLDIKREECFFLTLFYCTNSNSLEHNPNGEKHVLFYLKDKSNIVIDGRGAKIILYGDVTPILLDNCHNITIKNISFDYASPSMFEFKVLSFKNGEALIRPNERNNYIIKDNSLYWNSEKDAKNSYYFCYEYNGKDMLSMGLSKDNHLYYLPYKSKKSRFPSVPEIESIKENDDGTLLLVLKDKTVKLTENDIIQTRFTARSEVGGYFNNSKNISLDNINYSYMNGMGLVFQSVENVTLNKINITPFAGRVISSAADFFHFSNCNGKIKISNCIAIGAHDDVINVHGTYLLVDKVDQNKITLKFPHHETFGFNPFSSGDLVEFVNKNTLLPLFEAKVKESNLIDLFTIEVSIDEAVPSNLKFEECVVDNLSKKPSLLVERCHFQRIATRAILATTNKKVVIRNNVFKEINGPLLSVSNDASDWFESGRAGIIKLENNLIDSCNTGANRNGEPIILVNPSVKEDVKQIIHQKLIIKNNEFLNSFTEKFIINVSHLKELHLIHNRFTSDFDIKKDDVTQVYLKSNNVQK